MQSPVACREEQEQPQQADERKKKSLIIVNFFQCSRGDHRIAMTKYPHPSSKWSDKTAVPSC